MRVWGRINQTPDQAGGQWVAVETDANGYNDAVYLTALAQCLKLNLGESPFYANYGIPAVPSVISQIAPDYYVNVTQQQYAGFFASLLISKIPPKQANRPKPTYNLNITAHAGAILQSPCPV